MRQGIVCLPSCYKELSVDGIMPIPRKEEDVLASFGSVGMVVYSQTMKNKEA